MPAQMRGASPDPEASALMRWYHLLNVRGIGDHDVSGVRWWWQRLATTLGRSVPVAAVERHSLRVPHGDIQLQLYRPLGPQGLRPALLWLHGGGFVLGGLDTADAICRNIAVASGAVVVAVSYRLAPEHDLHAGREDCIAALEWLARHGASLDIDTSRLALGGDSAGGNLAAVLAQEAGRRGIPGVKLQVLVYPVTNLRDDFPSKTDNVDGYFLTTDVIEWINATIGIDTLDLSDVRLSPALNEDLGDLPRALIVTAGFDPIRDDGLAYTRRLRAAGVPVTLLHYAGQFHGFLNFDAVLRGARDALERIGAAVAAALGTREFDARRTSPPMGADLEDCTWEISATRPLGWRVGVGDFLPDSLIAWLMTGEWLESRRDAFLRQLVSGSPLAGAIAEPWLPRPLTSLRTTLAAQYAPLEARLTYTGNPAAQVRPHE